MAKDQRIMSYLDYFFVLRPVLFFPAWTMVLVGAYAASRFSDNPVHPGTLEIILHALIFTLTISAVYLINNIADQRNDLSNTKVFLINKDYISTEHARLYLMILLIIIAGASWMVSIRLFKWMFLIFIFWGMIYSVRPFALKDHPWGGLFISVFSGFLLFSFGWSHFASIAKSDVWLRALPYVAAWVSISLLTTIPDAHGDALDEKNTAAVKWGTERTQDIAYLLLGLSLFMAVMSWDWVIGLTGVFALPFYRKMWLERSVPATLRTIRWGVSFLSFAMFFVYPVYLGVCFIIFFLAKWYYKKRFNINYPTWKVNGV